MIIADSKLFAALLHVDKVSEKDDDLYNSNTDYGEGDADS